MLGGDNVAQLRLELGTDLAAPRAVFEALVHPRCLQNGRNVPTKSRSRPEGVDDAVQRTPEASPTERHAGPGV
jgi:hypothetical protein